MLAEIVLASSIASQMWCWDHVPTADGYRLYWSYLSNEWYQSQMIEVLEPEVCVSNALVPEPVYPGDLIYINMTAFNEYGESVTGWDEGTTHGEVLP